MAKEQNNQGEMSKAEATKLRMQKEYEARKGDRATKFKDAEIRDQILQSDALVAIAMIAYNRMIDDRWKY